MESFCPERRVGYSDLKGEMGNTGMRGFLIREGEDKQWKKQEGKIAVMVSEKVLGKNHINCLLEDISDALSHCINTHI